MRDGGAGEEDGFGGCKLLSPVVDVALDTLLAKAPSLVDNCMFRDRIDENVAGGSSCLRTHFVHGQLQQLSGVDLHCSAVMHRDNDLTGSVYHAQCCTLHATAQSVCQGYYVRAGGLF